MSDVVDLTRDLVSIPSHEDETEAGDFIERWLREETDAAVTRDESGNVIARRGDGDADSLALVGHHDVVPPADSQTEADGSYVVTERDGRLRGRGTADMKGAVAAAMLAFRDAVLSADADPAPELVFASFVGEEDGGVGARAAIDRGFAPDYAVVGEGSTGYSAPGATDVAVAHKGRRGSTVTARGSAAHASEPEAGENAVYRACDAVDVLRDLDFPSTEVFGERVEGSLAATEIDGGSAWNVIPEECTVTVDERTVPGERADLERVEAVEGVEWTVDQDLPPMRCDDEAFAETVLAAARAAQSESPELVTKPHATDAGWLAEAGTTCVVCGAAEPGEAHTETESVSVDVLERCYDIYRGTAENF
ncbi:MULTISPECIES: M20 family metallopeptidase [Halorussus]|uniref:M20 family metallopeptidase n=1 Tax=Halorussus TaxID=1070314 RepID=UPI000E21AC17|nr:MULTISPECIES: M20/M25/M40 family metallo-hydrolase [Halorussus]NHN57554.1 M20 family metallopeptidase [Halorussus sp. JP-T4]